MTQFLGNHIGNYTLIRTIGTGNFADVYLGEHIHLHTQAAIKVLHTRLFEGQVAQFHDEARTIAHLSHPHIIRVLDFGVQEGTPFLIMEYASAGTLRQQHPHGTQVPLSTVVSYVLQVADALQYAHDLKLVHRDIKPENILLRTPDEVVLSDFGLAMIAQSTASAGKRGMAGTIAYMAPEQIRGQPRRVSDQYSLAVLVYEWLCGRLPFTGTFTEVAVKHCLSEPPSLREQVPQLPSAVEDVVLQALAKSPEARFARIQDFAKALERAASSKGQHRPFRRISHILVPFVAPPSARQLKQEKALSLMSVPDDQGLAALFQAKGVLPNTGPLQSSSSLPELSSLSARELSDAPSALPLAQPQGQTISRRALLVGGLVGLTAIGGTLAWLTSSKRSSPPLPHQTPPLPTQSLPLGTRIGLYMGHSQRVNDISWAPDGRRIASASNDKTVQIWEAATQKSLLAYSHTDSVEGANWSPDGKFVASGGNDNLVRVWEAATGRTRYTFENYFEMVILVAWSPDGKHIATGGFDGIKIWDALTGQHILAYNKNEASSDIGTTAMAWSPDGTRLLSAQVSFSPHTLSNPQDTLEIHDTTTGKQLVSYQGHMQFGVYGASWSPDGTYVASGGNDKTVQIWNATTGQHVLTYHGHTDLINDVSWSHDGNYLASTGEDATVQIWDAHTGQTLFTYRGHPTSVNIARWSPDSRYIASTGRDKTIHVWRAA